MNGRQQGQVLPIGLALMAIGVMGALVLYNTGQLATDKMSLVNTVDAAAYSGTQWQARAMNFQSYTNRAMVANQVSIAQAVTLQSWVTYGAVTSENIATVLKPVPVINVVASGLETGLRVVETLMSPVSKAMLGVVDAVNRGLSTAQQAMFVSTFVATPDVVRAVVNQSDERFTTNTLFSGLGIAGNLNDWREFTEGYSKQDVAAMTERALMINQSLDDFSRQRNWKFFKSLWYYSSPLLRHRFYREGKTELVMVNEQSGLHWEWKAKDTLSLHNRLWRWRGTKRYEIPAGWAEAFANTRNSPQTIEPGACTPTLNFRNCARFLGMNGRAEYWADRGLPSPKNIKTQIAMRGYTGVQAFRSLSQAIIEDGEPHVKLKVEVAMTPEGVVSSDDSGMRGTFAAPVDAPGNRISSVSVAEVFYQRPDVLENPAQALEKANGYNPYWAARLSPVSNADRLLAFSLRSTSAGGSVPEGLPDIPGQLANYQDSTSSDAIASNEVSDNSPQLLDGGFSEAALVATPAGTDFDTAAASFDNTDLTGFQSIVREELNELLDRAVREMLRGAIEDQVGVISGSVEDLRDDLGASAQDAVAGVVTEEMSATFRGAVAQAEQISTALREEFRRIRTEISDEFALAVTDVRLDVETEGQPIRDEIARLLDNLQRPSLNGEDREEVSQQLSFQRQELRDLNAGTADRLARRLMEIVGQATDLYVMPYSDALYTVNEWLRAEEEDIELPWLDITDDDEDD